MATTETTIRSIGITTPTEGAISLPHLGKWAIVFFGAVLSAALLGLGIPRTLAAWYGFAANKVRAQVMAAQTPDERELREAVQSLRRDVGISPTGRDLADLGALELLIAMAQKEDWALRSAMLAAAQRHLERALAMNVAQGLAWYRLAQVRQTRNPFDGRPIVSALVNALDMAPNLRPLWTGRSIGLIIYREFLTPEEKEAFTSNLRTSWASDGRFRSELASMIASNEPALAFLEQALSNDVEALDQLQKLKVR